MMKRYIPFFYAMSACLVIVMDRVTKWYAVQHWVDGYQLHPLVRFHVLINRGVSWGLLFFSGTFGYIIITLLIVLVTIIISFIGWDRFRQGKFVLGEVLAVAGSVSNLYDRVVYHGVIDFIELSYKGWVWPTFNVADMAIVAGIGLMLVQYFR